jgi:hypothetical protein
MLNDLAVIAGLGNSLNRPPLRRYRDVESIVECEDNDLIEERVNANGMKTKR